MVIFDGIKQDELCAIVAFLAHMILAIYIQAVEHITG